jgi:hypothetical protein
MTKKPNGSNQEYLVESELRRAAVQAVIHWGIIGEARASVALDKDPECHTCHDLCDEFPQCPGRKNEY